MERPANQRNIILRSESNSQQFHQFPNSRSDKATSKFTRLSP